MPKINVYLPDELARAVRDAQVPVSAVCQVALERAVREVTAARGAEDVPVTGADAAGGLFSRFTPRARKAVRRMGVKQSTTRLTLTVTILAMLAEQPKPKKSEPSTPAEPGTIDKM